MSLIPDKGQVRLDAENLSDDAVLALSVKDPEAFREIVRRYERPFLRKAMSILRDGEDAQDAVQEAFVRIYSAAGRFARREGAVFSSWAFAVLVNQCYTAYRRKQRERSVSFDLHEELAESLADQGQLEEREHALAVEQAMSMISRLPDSFRRIVVSHFIHGVPQKLIAAAEGVSSNVIRTRIHRAKRLLRKMMLDQYESPSLSTL